MTNQLSKSDPTNVSSVEVSNYVMNMAEVSKGEEMKDLSAVKATKEGPNQARHGRCNVRSRQRHGRSIVKKSRQVSMDKAE